MRSVVLLALAIVTLGCTVEATDNPPAARPAAPPSAQVAAPAAGAGRLAGTVLETRDVSSYTYLRFETSDGEAWAAVPQARLEIGAQVVIANPQAMSNFESKTLGRSFDTIYFGTLEDPRAASPTAQGAANPHESRPGGTARTTGPQDANSTPIEVARAGGATGRTVSELYAERGELSGKSVALRGKVVKYSAGIMGRNWIHLQDGTGDHDAGTHDITVTSTGTTAIGEIILVEGTVAVDKDFGAGYRYAVIVEDAIVK